jgi:hypothetical protein
LTLVRLGELLQRPEMIDEGVRTVRAAGAGTSSQGKHAHARLLNQLGALLMMLARAPEAGAVLDQALSVAPEVPLHQSAYESSRPETLALQFALRHQAGRLAEALAMLETDKQWHADDVLDLLDRTVPLEDRTSISACSSRRRSRRWSERRMRGRFSTRFWNARRPRSSLRAVMKLEGGGAVARLEGLFARDQFEERPLIWKAKRLLENGRSRQPRRPRARRLR